MGGVLSSGFQKLVSETRGFKAVWSNGTECPGSDLLLSCFPSDSPSATPRWTGSLPYRLFLTGVLCICHCHWHHTLQQVAGPEPQTFLLNPPALVASVVASSLQQLFRDCSVHGSKKAKRLHPQRLGNIRLWFRSPTTPGHCCCAFSLKSFHLGKKRNGKRRG